MSVAPACPCHVAICRHACSTVQSAERHDRTVGLRFGEELTGQQQAVLWVLPAHEGLEARDPAGRTADDGEVVEPQLVTGDRIASSPTANVVDVGVSLISMRAPPRALASLPALMARRSTLSGRSSR